MKILIVNDDGFRGKGLHALVRALKDEHELTVVVPAMEQSGKSHSMTFLEPIFYEKFYLSEAEHDIYMIKGTPSDCVLMALDQIMQEPPDLVISGINKGYNAASAVVYSGTVSAAYEGASRGISAFALSAAFINADFDLVAKLFKIMLPTILEAEKERQFFYNINFPDVSFEQLKGIRKTTIAANTVTERMEKRVDPFSREYYWHAFDTQDEEGVCNLAGSDMEALHEGYISITPLKIDYLDKEKLDSMDGEFSDVFAKIKKL